LSVDNNAILRVSGINGYHAASSSVNFAYLLPENLIKACDFYDVEYQEMLSFKDFREDRDYSRYYTIKPFK
jgi:hypothetical protein